MSRVVRRKHVMKEMMEDDFELPTEQQQIVRVVSSRGNNLHEVEGAELGMKNFLVSMPLKFRKNVWIKRGDFLLVEPIEEGDKVKAEIRKILSPEHVKEFTKANVWPKKFSKKRVHEEVESEEDAAISSEDGADYDDGFKVQNPNRPAVAAAAYDEDDSSSTDDA